MEKDLDTLIEQTMAFINSVKDAPARIEGTFRAEQNWT
jgi:hypothetical protein